MAGEQRRRGAARSVGRRSRPGTGPLRPSVGPGPCAGRRWLARQVDRAVLPTAARRSLPRARLRSTLSSSGPSSVVRSTDWSSDIGLASSHDARARVVRPGCRAARRASARRSSSRGSRRARRRPARPRPAAAAAARGSSRPLTPAPRRQRGRQLLVAVDPPDLLDEVGLARDVVAPPVRDGRRRARRRRPRRRSRAARGSSACSSRGIGDAEQPLDARLAQPDRRGRRARRRRRRSSRPPAARRTARPSASPPAPGPPCASSGDSPFSNRPDASVRRPSRDEVRWMFGPVPGRRLHQHARGAVVDLRARAAHDPGDATSAPSASSITTMSGSSVRSTSSSVVIVLAVVRAPDDQPAARDEVGVERVHRLAAEQHHVVGDVDDVGDRPLPRGHQPRLQPRRRLAELDVLVQASR